MAPCKGYAWFTSLTRKSWRRCGRAGILSPMRPFGLSLALMIAAGIGVAVAPLALAAQPVASLPPSLTPFARQKAELLLRDKLACLGCHRLGRDGGATAPSLDSVRTHRSPAYIAAIISDPQRVVPGAAMPMARMAPSDRALIVRYFGGDPSATVAATNAPVAQRDTSAAALYGRWCAQCHGAKGRGDGPNATNLPVAPAKHADAATTSRRSDDALYDTIHGGGAIMNRSARMPAFGGTLAPAEIRSLVRYIRELCRCEGPAWSRGGGA